MGCFGDRYFDSLVAVCGRRVSRVVDSEPAGPSDDLPDLLIPQRSPVKTVEFGRLHEDHPPDGEIHSHADRVRGDHHVVFPLGKELGLPVPHVVGQRAVNDAAGHVPLFELGGHRVDIAPGKDDQRVSRPDVLREAESFFFIYKRRHPPVADDLVVVPAIPDDLCDALLRLGSRADVDLRGAHAHDGRRPRAAALAVRDHLGLVDHGHVVFDFQAEHLDCG